MYCIFRNFAVAKELAIAFVRKNVGLSLHRIIKGGRVNYILSIDERGEERAREREGKGERERVLACAISVL